MIKNVFIDGIQVNDENLRLQKVGSAGSAEVEFADYQRGGTSGQILSRPLYRGMTINMGWFVKGNSSDNFISNLERFIGYFSNNETPSNYLKTLGFELTNGVIKEIDVLFSRVNNEISGDNVNHSFVTLSAVSELEFLTSRTTKTGNLVLLSLGGMAIPMPIPMNMANNPVGEPLIALNSGNALSYPIITVHGVFDDDFTITNDTTGDTLVYTGGLETGHYITIDTYYRTATLDGATSVLGSITGDWVYLGRGSNSLRISSSDGSDTGYASVSWHDSDMNI